MKYLRTYESTEFDSFGLMKLKDYVVWELNLVLIILKVRKIYLGGATGISEYAAEFERLYIYTEDGRIRKSEPERYNFDYKEIKKHVIYDSDNLDECLDKDLLGALKNSNKYNI